MKQKFVVLLIFAFLFVLICCLPIKVIATNLNSKDVDIENIDSDLFISDKEGYKINGQISGNIFNTSKDFMISDISTVNGNLFVVAKKVSLNSNISYSDALSKDNEPAIGKINSKAIINGNVFVVCNEFVMESGCEIHGDLFVVAEKIIIKKSAVISGNIFATSEDFSLNGKVECSVYATSKNFQMNYFGSIHKDLNLSSKNAILSSVIHRNVKITSGNIETDENFLTYGDLTASASSFSFSGEIDGNAIIEASDFEMIHSNTDGNEIQCIIKGDLNYSTKKEISNIDSYVNGAVVHSSYNENTNKKIVKFNLKNFILELFTFIIYVFVIAWLYIVFNKKCLSVKSEYSIGKIFAALGIGLLTIIVVVVLSILLLLINIGVTLSFTLIFTYIFTLFLSIPLFVLDLAKLFKEKINIYLGILLISLILFIINTIPYVGGIIAFLFIMIGDGKIILSVLSKIKEKSK